MRYLLLPLFFLLAAAGTFLVFHRSKPLIFESPLGFKEAINVETLRQTQIVYGYLPYWNLKKAQYPDVLTHVSFFSLPIQADGHLLPLPTEEQGARAVDRGVLDTLKAEAPKAKLELTLTMMGQDTIPEFLASPSATENLISDFKQLMRDYPISGVNIDIEYIRPPTPDQQQLFTTMLKNFYTAIKAVSPNFHISVAVLTDSVEKTRLTNIAAIAPYTDHIVIMAYDFHRKNSITSGANAPLYGGGDTDWGKNIMASAKEFTDLVPAQKLILGVPFYGYEWSVATSDNPYNFTLPDSGAVATYDRITKLIRTGKAVRHWDQNSYTPYLLYTDQGKQQQIYYEDAQSLGYKLDLVKQAGFGGIAIWCMGYEGNTSELWQTIANKLH